MVNGLIKIADFVPIITLGTGGVATGDAMKMAAEYLEHAHQFERLANTTDDSKLKALFLNQAAIYRDLARKRAVAEWRSPMPASGGNDQTETETRITR
jgi:hypothetical protein